MYQIHEAKTKEEREAVYRFRYKLYVEQLNRIVDGTDHERKICVEPHDEASTHYYVVDQDLEIIGVSTETPLHIDTIPEYWRKCLRLDLFEGIDRKTMYFDSRLMLHPDVRGTDVLWRLMAYKIDKAYERGFQYLLLDCPADLVGLYEVMGARRYTDNFWEHEGKDYLIPMLGIMHDIDYLKRIQSPLLDILEKYPRTEVPFDLLYERFPRLKDYFSAPPMNQEELIERMTTLIAKHSLKPEPTLEIFKDLTQEEVQNIMRRATLLDVGDGDRIIYQGEISSNMFLVLGGLFEVRLDRESSTIPLKLLGPGDIFGEISFILDSQSTENVYAFSDGKVLLFNYKSLQSLSERNPETYYKFTKNLLRILAQRVSDTNQLIRNNFFEFT